MDKEKKDSLKRVLINHAFLIIIVLLFSSIILLGNWFIFSDMENEYKNVVYTFRIENILKEKNVSMPMPDYKKELYEHYDIGKFYNGSVEEFGIVINSYYIHNNTYDCKYWTYQWAKWWMHNKDRLNLDMKYITTDNHIFLMVYNESGYCTLDGREHNCYWKRN